MPTATTAPRGDSTRESLLDAATRVFARYGYDAASNRLLAETAGTNQALISYHFGGKRGLYLAVFAEIEQRVSARLMPRIGEVLARIDGLDPESRNGRRQAVDCTVGLLEALVDVFLGEDTADWARLLLREQQEPTEAFELVYQGPMKRMLGTVTRLVGIASGGDPDVDPAITAMMLISQVMIFRVAHAAAVRHLGWDQGIGEVEIGRIKRQVNLAVRSRFPTDDHS